MPVVQVQHVLRLVRNVKPEPLTHADVPCVAKLAVQPLLNATRALLPLADELFGRVFGCFLCIGYF